MVNTLSTNKGLLVIALGGNAFLQKGEKGTLEEQWRNVNAAAEQIVELIEEGYKVVLTHGNGPQVGNVLEWMDALKHKIPPLTMDIAGAMTQGWIGYMLQQALQNKLVEKGLDSKHKVVTLVNQVKVDPRDEAWKNPTKYIGPYYTEEEAKKLQTEKNWTMKKDPRGGWRRVVPSPYPIDNIEKEAIKTLYEKGFIVIASGGGGIPVIEENGRLKGVEAVIDKDLAGQLLARLLGAERFIILTDVEGAYKDFGKPTQKLLTKLTVAEAEKLLKNGEFGAGSMGPKIRAAIEFAKHAGKPAHIGHLIKVKQILEGKSGTTITP